MFIFERERKRERVSLSWGGGESERETQNLIQAPGSELSAQSPMQGSNSGVHDLIQSWTLNHLSHPGTPIYFQLKNIL